MATQEEIRLIHQCAPANMPIHYAQPCIWAEDIVHKMREEGTIDSGRSVELIVRQLADFRGGLGSILCYDWINFPLVYTQVCSSLAPLLYTTRWQP